MTMVHYSTIGMVIDTVGKLLVSFTAIMVHHRVLGEHKIDEEVFREMKREQKLGIMGVSLIVIGSGLEILASIGILTP